MREDIKQHHKAVANEALNLKILCDMLLKDKKRDNYYKRIEIYARTQYMDF